MADWVLPHPVPPNLTFTWLTCTAGQTVTMRWYSSIVSPHRCSHEVNCTSLSIGCTSWSIKVKHYLHNSIGLPHVLNYLWSRLARRFFSFFYGSYFKWSAIHSRNENPPFTLLYIYIILNTTRNELYDLWPRITRYAFSPTPTTSTFSTRYPNDLLWTDCRSSSQPRWSKGRDWLPQVRPGCSPWPLSASPCLWQTFTLVVKVDLVAGEEAMFSSTLDK